REGSWDSRSFSPPVLLLYPSTKSRPRSRQSGSREPTYQARKPIASSHLLVHPGAQVISGSGRVAASPAAKPPERPQSISISANPLAAVPATQRPPRGGGDRVLDEVDRAVGERAVHAPGMDAAWRRAARWGHVILGEKTVGRIRRIVRALHLVRRAEVI